MAETFPNETLNWTNVTNTGGVLPSGTSIDTGGTLVTVTSSPGDYDASYVGTTNAGGSYTGVPYPQRTLLSHNQEGVPTTTTFRFNDDPTVTGTVNTVENLTFSIFDIDSSGGTEGYTDKVTLSAFDANNEPVKIIVTESDPATYKVDYNDDGSVTITGTSEHVPKNVASSSALISFG